ncbi:hypothetical protein LSH36_602g01019 [Paralvinella palmiformis]|uniref:Uncharacterized protein n=1 Tax=Paralvinella palmiformis TaxID=53620 RepID=A0AAD9MWC3_9ANNE|nr:hypothetical protein LSH36_602g01019 [Paralvinella palmiformis]
MSAFNGKWKRISATNVDEFVKASGFDGEKATKLKAFLTTVENLEELMVTDVGINRKVYINGQLTRELNTNFNEPQEKETLLGKSTIIGKKISDNRLEYTETGSGRPDGFSVITIEGDKLILDYTIGDVTCRRTYQKQ